MSADQFKQEGNQAFAAKDYAKAIELFSKAIEVSETPNHVLYSNRSACYASSKDFAKALEDAKECVKINPSWAKGYNRLGAAHYGLGDLDEAEQSYKKALELDSSNKAGSWDGRLVVVDYLHWKVVRDWKFKEKIFHVCGSTEWIVYSLSGGKVKSVELPSWKIKDTDSGLKYQCRSCALIPNGRGFVQGSIDGRVSVEFFDAETSKFAFRCHRMNLEDVQLVFPVTALAFQPDSLNLYTGGADGKIVSWNLVTRKKQEELPKLDDSIVKLCCTDEYLVIGTSDDSFRTCAIPQDIELHDSAIYIKYL